MTLVVRTGVGVEMTKDENDCEVLPWLWQPSDFDQWNK